MNRAFRWVATVSAMAVTMLMASCDSVGDMTQPELSPSPIVVTSTSGKRYVIAVEQDPAAGSVSATIGQAGGLLNLGRHSLVVSKNAVSAPTRFTMTRDPANALRVKLTAGRDSENDVGVNGFEAPVYLSLSFQKAEDAPRDRSLITIVYFRPDGLVEELETRVTIIGKTAVAKLPHFSLFGIAWP